MAMDIYRYIRESRERRFRNAKAFWAATKPPFSYEYYSSIERGTKFPNIETLLFICEQLRLNRKRACFLWAAEMMPDAETREFFHLPDEAEEPIPLGSQITLEKTFLVTSAHKRLLEASPLYWEVLSFFATYEEHSFTLPEILERIAIPKFQLLRILGDLVAHDLLKYQRRRYAHPKTYMHIPNDREFFRLRNRNFLHAAKQLIYGLKPADVVADRAFRTTINKQLTAAQVERAMTRVKATVTELLNFEPPRPNENGVPYSFCALLCERDFSRRASR
jgi:hypothetical protein